MSILLPQVNVCLTSEEVEKQHLQPTSLHYLHTACVGIFDCVKCLPMFTSTISALHVWGYVSVYTVLICIHMSSQLDLKFCFYRGPVNLHHLCFIWGIVTVHNISPCISIHRILSISVTQMSCFIFFMTLMNNIITLVCGCLKG